MITIEGGLHEWLVIKELIKEIIIVASAAIIVSLYFEYRLRNQISEEFNKILEIKEEFGKAGIIKYYHNFKDINLRSLFTSETTSIDIYVNFAHTVFNQIQDSISDYVKKNKVELNIFILSPENKFISGLGTLWGKNNSDYNEDGIKSKIDQSLQTLKTTFEDLKNKSLLKAEIKVYLLKINPVFYSFYRFNDEMIYVPSKIVELKTFIPLCFLVKRTIHSEGIFNKCMEELRIIRDEPDGLVEFYKNERS